MFPVCFYTYHYGRSSLCAGQSCWVEIAVSHPASSRDWVVLVFSSRSAWDYLCHLCFFMISCKWSTEHQWQNSTQRMWNYPAFQTQVATSLCRNLITMHSASACLLSYTLLMGNNFVKHNHSLQAPCFVLFVYFEMPCLAASTSAHFKLYSLNCTVQVSYTDFH